jgi:putative phosphoribosyl transferase
MSRTSREVAIAISPSTPGGSAVILDGLLEIPAGALGLVLFAHGSGSSRHSPRNRFVAEILHDAKIATLLFDLLTSAEAERDAIDASLRFDIHLLARRVVGAIDWVDSIISILSQDAIGSAPIGLFGASTGAAAALVGAAMRRDHVAAVVSRGGRADLAGEALLAVRAPTLLIVGSRDVEVIRLNQAAASRMKAPVQLELIHGAGHLFEEPGSLERVANRAAEFFREQFIRVRSAPLRE